MQTILIAEDEPAIAEAAGYALRAEGFAVEHVLLGGAVLPRIRAGGIDLVILDVGLPDGSGFDVCRALRREYGLPVVFLTARHGEVDRVLGLELGADDYVVKPFSPRELVARVRAHLRRAGGAGAAPAYSQAHAAAGRWQAIGTFELDRDGRRIRYRGELLELTRYEHGVLEALLTRPGAVLSRAQLMDRVWIDAPDSSDRTVDTHVKTLRAKLRASAGGGADPIRTHRGLGYSIDAGGAGPGG